MNKEIEESRTELQLTKTNKRCRIIFDDPDATDASDDESVVMHNNVKRACVVRDLDNGVKSPNEPGLVHGKYRGVRQRRWGRWCAEIRVPMERKRIWLRSFDTAEEASRAYERKRMEFDDLIKPVDASGNGLDNVVRRIRKLKMGKRRGNTDEEAYLETKEDQDPAPKSENFVQKGKKWNSMLWPLGSKNRRNGKWAIVIQDPISEKRVWLGEYNTAEEAFNTFQMKKLEVDALTNPVDFSSDRSENCVAQHIAKLKAIFSDNSSASEQYCATTKRMEFDALTKPVDLLSDKSIEKPKACLSDDSRDHAFALNSDTSPASDGQIMHRKLQHVDEVFNVDEQNEAPKSGNSINNNNNYRAKIPYRRKGSYIYEESAPGLVEKKKSNFGA